MFTRLRSTWTAGGGALLLVVALSGVVAGASLVSDALPTGEVDAEQVVDTTLTWEDSDGDGVDDDCQEAVVAAPDAAAAAETAADLDGDGVVSVSEAAQSDRTGGTNCNHGGYVSIVAQGDDPTTDEETADEEIADEEVATECETPVEPEPEPVEPIEPVVLAPNAHGRAVSEVARSDAVGGKNCNHGGAVSEVAKDKAAKAERDAAKAAAKAERDAAKAARAAARDAAKAEHKAARDAAKAARH